VQRSRRSDDRTAGVQRERQSLVVTFLYVVLPVQRLRAVALERMHNYHFAIIVHNAHRRTFVRSADAILMLRPASAFTLQSLCTMQHVQMASAPHHH
jgi:hypothetical protein